MPQWSSTFDERFLNFVYGKTRTFSSDWPLEYASKSLEYILAQKLNSMCYPNGREIEERKTALVLYHIGCVYRLRSFDKQSLLQSAALFCAAIVRQPDNVADVEESLDELIRFTLKQAGAPSVEFDFQPLLSTSCYEKLDLLRKTAKQELSEIEPIPDDLSPTAQRDAEIKKTEKLRNLQGYISKEYCSIMNNILHCCVAALGKPQCKYALVGLGSLAKQEITPYSDFESLIILEDGVKHRPNYFQILENFRWLAVLFQILLISFGETIIRFMHIRSLNDPYDRSQDWFYDAYTPCGICPDGFAPHASKNPLGRQHGTLKKAWKTELIRPVSEMLKYLESKEDIKNGYHLADVLTKTCFVSGDKDVYEKFLHGVNLAAARHVGVEQLRKQLAEDSANFDIRERLSTLHFSDTFDMKRVIYRSTTLFLAALGRYLNISAPSSFHTVDQLEASGELSADFARKLRYAVAVACEIRLRSYSSRNEQQDRIHWDGSNITMAINKTRILESLGVQSFVDYFVIASRLRVYVEARLFDDPEAEAKAIKKEGATATIDRAAMFKLFGFYDRAITAFQETLTKFRRTGRNEVACWKEASLVFCLCKAGKYAEAISCCDEFLKCHNTSRPALLCISGECLTNLGKHASALEKLEESLQLCPENEALGDALLRADGEFRVGLCLQRLRKYDQARKQYRKAQDIYKRNKLKQTVVDCLDEIGTCWICEHNYEKALNIFEEKLALLRVHTDNEECDAEIAFTLQRICECLFQLRRGDELKEYANQSLNIYEEILEIYENEEDLEIEELIHCRENLAECLDILHREEDALECRGETADLLQQALNLSLPPQLNADYTGLLGLVLKRMGRVDEAVRYFKEEINILESCTESAAAAMKLLLRYSSLAVYLQDQKMEVEAAHYFEREMQLHEICYLSEDSAENNANNLMQIGGCLMRLGRYSDALEKYEQEIELRRRCKPDYSKSQFGSLLNDGSAEADSLRTIGYMLYKMKKYDEAINRYKEELLIRVKHSSDPAADRSIGELKKEVGYCYYRINNYDEALRWLREAVEVCENAPVSLTVATTSFIAEIGIGKVYMSLSQNEDALETLLSALMKLIPAWRNQQVKKALHGFAFELSQRQNSRVGQRTFFEKNAPKLRDQPFLKSNSCEAFIDCLDCIGQVLRALAGPDTHRSQAS